ncbi:MAG: FHA domain-containing protein [bacterium]|nr:FHA domain-containing protein [bacterium]
MARGDRDEASGAESPGPLEAKTQRMAVPETSETSEASPLEEATVVSPPPSAEPESTVVAAPVVETPTVVAAPVEETPTVVAAPVVEHAAAVSTPVDDETTADSTPADEAAAAVSATVVMSSVDAAGGDPNAAIAPSAALHPMLLERIEPSLGRGERLRLDAAHWHVRIGRAEHNDLRLYTASASREHAVIAGNEAGEWILTPVGGKSVSIDGTPTEEPVELEVGMNLVLGGDHLRCVTEGLEREEMAAPTAADGLSAEGAPRRGGRASWIAIGLVAALGIGLIAYAWFAG